jgi:hypothetical protein
MRPGRVSWLLLFALTSHASAQDDWALTRRAVEPQDLRAAASPRAGQLAAARKLALEGRHTEAAAALEALKDPVLLGEVAREHLAAGDPEAALRALASTRARASELAELEREAYRRAGRGRELAEREERAGRWRAAAVAWELEGEDARALAAYQREPAYAVEALRLLRKLGRVDEAERLASQLSRRSPDPAPLIALAELRRAAGRRDDALAVLAERARAQPRSLALHRALRSLYAAWGERALEERELTRLVALEPGSAALHIALADAALLRGDRERALAELQRAGALDPSPARHAGGAEARVAELLAERDLLQEALSQLAAARARAPDVRAYLELQASVLERAGRLGEAERAHGELLASATRSEQRRDARRHLAGLWRRAGTLDAHTAALRAGLAENFELEPARMLAELYGREPGRAQALRELLARILERDPQDHDAQLLLARAQRQAGELHAALQSMLRALGSEPRELDEALELAHAAARDPLVPALLERARAIAPNSPRAHAEAALLYTQRDELELARAAYARALALDPGAHGLRLAWAELERVHGGRDVAIAQLGAVLAHARNQHTVMQAATRLALLDRAQALAALLAGAAHPPHRRALLTLWVERPQEAREPALRAALLEGDSDERALALSLLVASASAGAAPLLVAFSVQSERPLAERAAALRGLAGDARLLAVYSRLERSLRPIALWALAGRAEAAPLFARELSSRDPATRAMAALAGGDPALDSERDPRVRAAALWALAKRAPSRHADALRAAARAGSTLALSALDRDDPALAEALFDPRAPVRSAAARALLGAPADVLPMPRWPFSLDQYLAELAQAGPLLRAEPEVWGPITRAAQANVARDALFAPSGPGLLPRALVELGACPSPGHVSAFSAALQAPLRALGTARGTALLVHAGGADGLATLRVQDPAQLRTLLRELAGRSELPTGLAPALAHERSEGDWPTRMWATRALRELDPAEPMKLVRTLALSTAARERPSGGCAVAPQTAN